MPLGKGRGDIWKGECVSAREGQWRRQQLRLVARVWKRLWVASFLSGIGYFLRFRVGEGGVYCSFFVDCFLRFVYGLFIHIRVCLCGGGGGRVLPYYSFCPGWSEFGREKERNSKER